MTSIALNPGITLPVTPHVHNGCCGHAHHHDVQSPDANELAQKQVETSEPGFLTALWQKIKRWIWGDSEDAQLITDTKMDVPETSIQKQLHHAVPDKVSQELRTNSQVNLSGHNHSGCSDGTCSIKQPSITESRSSGGHIHSGGCCGGVHRVSNSTNLASSGPSFSSASRGSQVRSARPEPKQAHISNDDKPEHSCAHHGTCGHDHDHDHDTNATGPGLVQLGFFNRTAESSSPPSVDPVTEVPTAPTPVEPVTEAPTAPAPVEPPPTLTTAPTPIDPVTEAPTAPPVTEAPATKPPAGEV